MPRYMLLPMDRPDPFDSLAPDEIQTILQRYIAWSDALRAGGRMLDGNKLVDNEGRVLRRDEGRIVVRDGPYAETKEVIGGYWLVQADSYDDAVSLARDCPHLDYGTLVIRQIEEM